MSVCSECGGNVISTQNLVYMSDGSSSGNYICQSCGLKKPWSIKGNGQKTINMK